MANTSDFRMGLCLNHENGDLVQIIDFQHVKPGKGGAFVRTKFKSLKTGKIYEHTFNAGEKVDTARVVTQEYQYLYKEDTGYVFMHNETFDQVTIDEKLVTGYQFMKEGQLCLIQFHEETETALSCELPSFVNLMITYSEPAVKGNTATNAMKKAVLETGAEILVPMFVDQDELIKIDTRDGGKYVERVKVK
ncbi:MAG: elongation factor P [Cytophagales bacterium]|nr:MAG: elongation factor P [Cytophagales bacterium]